MTLPLVQAITVILMSSQTLLSVAMQTHLYQGLAAVVTKDTHFMQAKKRFIMDVSWKKTLSSQLNCTMFVPVMHSIKHLKKYDIPVFAD